MEGRGLSDLRMRKQAICSLFSSIALWRRVCEQPLGPGPQHVASQPCLTWKEKPKDTVKGFFNRLLLQSPTNASGTFSPRGNALSIPVTVLNFRKLL